MYEYFHVKVAANASPMLARYSIDPEYQNIIIFAAARAGGMSVFSARAADVVWRDP